MKKSAAQLDREIATALRTRSHARKRKVAESPYEIKTRRLKALQAAMADAEGAEGWLHTDLDRLEGWIHVDDALSNVQWQREAMKQLQDQSVQPEHAGAASANVYAWNDAFITTYRMNVDMGMNPQDARDSASDNAFASVKLTGQEFGQINTDPALYKGSK